MFWFPEPSSRVRPARVGVTGGIGSGKSTVCRIIESLGYPVYYADAEAKRLLNDDPELIKHIKAIFGEDSYKNGQYNREWVAKQVFSNPDKLAALNAAAHPAVERDAQEWNDRMHQKGNYITVKEAALMIESGSYRHMDLLILVTAPEPLRIQRVMQRDHLTEEAVRKRIAAQMPEEEKSKFAHYVIVNDCALSTLENRVIEVMNEIVISRTDSFPPTV